MQASPELYRPAFTPPEHTSTNPDPTVDTRGMHVEPTIDGREHVGSFAV